MQNHASIYDNSAESFSIIYYFMKSIWTFDQKYPQSGVIKGRAVY